MPSNDNQDRRAPVITIPASWFPYILAFLGLASGTGLTTVGGMLTRSGDVDSAINTAVKAANAQDDVRIQILENNNRVLKEQIDRIEKKLDQLLDK